MSMEKYNQNTECVQKVKFIPLSQQNYPWNKEIKASCFEFGLNMVWDGGIVDGQGFCL
jgi:hypothetical protein